MTILIIIAVWLGIGTFIELVIYQSGRSFNDSFYTAILIADILLWPVTVLNEIHDIITDIIYRILDPIYNRFQKKE